MKYLTIGCLLVFGMLFTSCKTDTKKVDDEGEMIEANEKDGLDYTEVEEEEDYSDLLERAIMALEGNDKELAVQSLNKASDYFKPDALENEDEKESEKLAAAINKLSLDVQNDKIKTSDALLAAIKEIDGLKEMFNDDEDDEDDENDSED